jgi:hypothetical protein
MMGNDPEFGFEEEEQYSYVNVGNSVYMGMLHACASDNIEAIKLISGDYRYNLEKYFSKYITAAHLKSARISDINVETYCLGANEMNEMNEMNETVKYLLDNVCITPATVQVALKFAVFYKYTGMIKKILTTPIKFHRFVNTFGTITGNSQYKCIVDEKSGSAILEKFYRETLKIG